ncbi:MAG: signal peptidase I [Anaerovoracaceae bacterium]
MNIVKRIFDILSNIVLALIIVFIIMAVPIIAGFKPVVVLSGSMEPTYPVGSIIYHRSTSFEKLSVGDPITFKAEGNSTMITHRIVVKNDLSRTVVTKGDANKTEDINQVKEENIIGKATKFAIPYAGYLVTFTKRIPVIIILAGILIISFALNTLMGNSKKNEES